MSKEKPGQNPENSPDFSVEVEPQQQADLAWLGGILEITGSVRLTLYKDSEGILRAHPQLRIRTNRPAVRDHLSQVYGGWVNVKGGEWVLAGAPAARLMIQLRNVAISRLATINAFEQWLNAANREERIAIAYQLNKYESKEFLPIEAYQELVQNDAFVAGIVDLRGTIYANPHGKYFYPKVTIAISSEGLMQALAARFKGYISVASYAGSLRIVGGQEFQTTHNKYTVNFSAASARELITAILPYAKTTPYDGWDEQVSVKNQQLIEEGVDFLLEFIKNEMDLLEAGKIPRLSTKKEIVERFPDRFTSASMVQRRIELFPEEVKKRRMGLIRSTKETQDLDVQALVHAIIFEIEQYERGEIDLLNTNDDWISQGFMGRGVFKRRVVKELPPEVAEKRQYYLHRQAALRSAESRKKKG